MGILLLLLGLLLVNDHLLELGIGLVVLAFKFGSLEAQRLLKLFHLFHRFFDLLQAVDQMRLLIFQVCALFTVNRNELGYKVQEMARRDDHGLGVLLLELLVA